MPNEVGLQNSLIFSFFLFTLNFPLTRTKMYGNNYNITIVMIFFGDAP